MPIGITCQNNLRNTLIVVLISPKKVFITFTHRVNVMKLSTLSLMLLQNKLVFVPGKAFSGKSNNNR
jgi:hypothetical protein